MISIPSGLSYDIDYDFVASGHIDCAYFSGVMPPTSGGYITVQGEYGNIKTNYHGVYTTYKCWNCSKFFRPLQPQHGFGFSQVDCPHCGQKG